MHPSHQDEIPKINRALGQVEAVKRMVDDGKYCIEIITQLRAARAALKSVEMSILERHMGSCLARACNKDDASRAKQVSEIITLLKKYE